MKNRYAFLTVDTEALPNRAQEDHVNRLILGKHDGNQAGVLEMAAIAGDFGARILFFVDMCGAWEHREEIGAVIRQLMDKNQDVQLHAHPEYLPDSFWKKYRMNKRPYYLNTYSQARADFMLSLLAGEMEKFTGEKVLAFRAGSFRWNSATLESLRKLGIRYSFNNSMCAMRNHQCPFSLQTNQPFRWSNGVYEIPVTERQILSFINSDWWARLQYPQSRYFNFRSPLFTFLPGSASHELNPVVFLIHSWSFLHRDKNGYEVYKNDALMENFRKFLRLVSQEYDIITSRDLDYLIESGKIPITHVEDIKKAEALPKKTAQKA